MVERMIRPPGAAASTRSAPSEDTVGTSDDRAAATQAIVAIHIFEMKQKLINFIKRHKTGIKQELSIKIRKRLTVSVVYFPLTGSARYPLLAV